MLQGIQTLRKDDEEQEMKRYKFVIDAFEGEGAGASAAAAETSGQVTTADGDSNPGIASPENGTDKRPFEDVIKDYKDEYTKDFQKKWDARHKDYMATKTLNSKQGKLIERIALKYGIDNADDLDAIDKAMQADDDLVASRALSNGLTVEQQRYQDDIELENRRYREEQKRQAQAQNAQRQYQQWMDESNNLKAVFPSFDLDTELQNETFRQCVRAGMPIERAFYAAHGAEIASGAMQYTAQAVRKATEEEISNRTPRPKENGVARQAAAKVSTDVHGMTRQQRAELAKRSMREKVYF